jgi:hypothetical protein
MELLNVRQLDLFNSLANPSLFNMFMCLSKCTFEVTRLITHNV